ncbi:hypothetical protein N6B72_17810 [Chryseobacterium soli]|uniref:Uncharacterized protein n=1 Tax=Chryseobacterium soli TaxID=445961 RepID=A0A086A2K2_9FLAO|nr:hypothetical protein [Chryseobacterium soli]KFF10916.1 hypothetical protein IW15_17225 [Chryseobacterium soli]MDV7698786.1 hypothetical protein [Chryseobacterium soli]
MKTILKYDSKIQLVLIILFVLTLFATIFSDGNFIITILLIEFFLIAAVQYSLNVIKFFSKTYLKTDSRKVYMFLSTYVVTGFFILVVFNPISIDGLRDIFELMVITWMILSPVLIFQSLFISCSDSKIMKSPL